MARQLAQACEYGLFIGEGKLLHDRAQRLRQNDAVLIVHIADRDGLVRVQLGPAIQLSVLDSTSQAVC